jgi:ectoine hydroxylase-related dioxygenase (phytanoyl-CoA dioxygenase family)
MTYITSADVDFFEQKGYLVIENMLTPEEVQYYRELYERFLSNQIDASRYRSDLGAGAAGGPPPSGKERITQIMLISRLHPEVLDKGLHRKTTLIARQLLGEDMDLDFDMLIDKAPHSATATPWHQDCAYWITMPDTRAVSCWVALDDAEMDNGCMWYVEGSHRLPVRRHWKVGEGGALQCEASEQEGTPVEIKAGSCVLHHGATLHYSRGNTTGKRRRAFINNFRPAAMIAFEREHGFDHSGERDVRDERAEK